MKDSERFRIWVEGGTGNWKVHIKIDQQTFTPYSGDTKAQAMWFAKMWRHAFSKLEFINDVTL
jgi:hypothetical protein